MSRIAVAGGTGTAGRQIAAVLRERGHEPVIIARCEGVDLLTGKGLAEALADVTAVIDASNVASTDPSETQEFFATTTGNLLAAEQQAGTGHHVVLSVVGVDRARGNAHYAGKREQERVALAGPIPVTVVRATQFMDFPMMVAGWVRQGDEVPLAPLLMQPVALRDVAAFLVEVALGQPRNGICELAGPQTEDMVDMARRAFAARGESPRLIPTWRGMFGTGMAGEVLLPGPGARIATTTFDEWLAGQRAGGG